MFLTLLPLVSVQWAPLGGPAEPSSGNRISHFYLPLVQNFSVKFYILSLSHIELFCFYDFGLIVFGHTAVLRLYLM